MKREKGLHRPSQDRNDGLQSQRVCCKRNCSPQSGFGQQSQSVRALLSHVLLPDIADDGLFLDGPMGCFSKSMFLCDLIQHFCKVQAVQFPPFWLCLADTLIMTWGILTCLVFCFVLVFFPLLKSSYKHKAGICTYPFHISQCSPVPCTNHTEGFSSSLQPLWQLSSPKSSHSILATLHLYICKLRLTVLSQS